MNDVDAGLETRPAPRLLRRADRVLGLITAMMLAAMVLLACVARGFGSTRVARDLAVGLVLGLAVFLFFVRFLNVNLPAGWLLPILGGAGL